MRATFSLACIILLALSLFSLAMFGTKGAAILVVASVAGIALANLLPKGE
jgi:hypothetical protein